MGRLISTLAAEKHFTIVATIDKGDVWPAFSASQLPDVAIEFTSPEAAPENLRQCIQRGIPVVCGTTGWHESLPEMISLARTENASLMYGSNFSVGVNLWFKIIHEVSERLSLIPEYRPMLEEIHHIHKLDKPSGTAISAAQIVLQSYPSLSGWSAEDNMQSLPVISQREGEVPGTHRLLFKAMEDEIEISHIAHNRRGFAKGVLQAAEWLVLHPGVYDFTKVFDQIFTFHNK